MCVFFNFRKAPVEQRVVEDIKASPQGSGSPGTPTTPSDRAAAKRAELRRIERRRREAVSRNLMLNIGVLIHGLQINFYQDVI